MDRLIVVKAPRGESVETVVGRRALPGEACDFAELTTAGDALVIRYVRAAVAAVEVEAVEHPIVAMNAKAAKAWAAPEVSVDALADALAAEVDGPGRKSVIKAIEDRLVELTGGD